MVKKKLIIFFGGTNVTKVIYIRADVRTTYFNFAKGDIEHHTTIICIYLTWDIR